MNTVNGKNTGESSTQDNIVKSPVYMPKPENLAGNESGVSTTAGYGATSGKVSTGVEYAVKDVNQRNATRQPYLNIDNSEENRAAKYKYPTVSEDVPEAARSQYE